MASNAVISVVLVAVVALLASPVHGGGCDVKAGPKFQANQTGTYPGQYWWQLSPCEASGKMCSGTKAYILQYDQGGQCDPLQLRCTQAPTVTKTKTGYTLNYFCGKTLNGEKDAIVNVVCGKGPLKLTTPGIPVATGQSGQDHFIYTFNLEGECGGFDYGWIFIILVIVGLFIYFVAGFLFNFFVRKLRGLEAIPNIGFWKDLPGLIKDGFMFVFCRRRGGFKSVA